MSTRIKPSPLLFAGLILLLLVTGALLLWQKREVTRLRSTNDELRQQLELVQTDLLKATERSGRVDAVTRSLESKTTELNQLRAEVTRLRRELTEATNAVARLSAATAPMAGPREIGPVEPVHFTRKAVATLTPGQTLIMGGWATEPGKRTLGLFTPDATATDDGSILINSVYVSVPESLLTEPGWEHFLTSGPDQAGNGVFEAGQAGQFLEALKAAEGAEVLSSPRLITLSGREAVIAVGEQDGSGLSMTVLPVLAPDGRSVHLVVSNSLQQPRLPTGP